MSSSTPRKRTPYPGQQPNPPYVYSAVMFNTHEIDDTSVNASNMIKKDSVGGEYPEESALTVQDEIVFLTGWQLIFTTIGLLIGFFLSNLEVTIVSSSLTSITSSLTSFDKTSWIVTGYLITYTGSITIWTKVSEIIGRKNTSISALVIFLAFSIGCGCAQTINQMIICRVLQGIGGAGSYTLAILCFYEIVPKPQVPIYGGLLSFCLALAALFGPMIGGSLAQKSAWRWVFLVNAPLCAMAIIILIFSMPAKFGPEQLKPQFSVRSSFELLAKVDIMGIMLMMSGSFLLVSVLNETHLSFEWSSGSAIALLVLSALSWVGFVVWEWVISNIPGKDPIFPRRFLSNRPWVGIMLSTFFTGAPFNVVIVYLPQRAQILLGRSPFHAGVYLIGYSATAAAGAALATIMTSKGRVPFIYSLIIGSTIHVIGIGLLSTIVDSKTFTASEIGYEIIAGAGIGLTMAILVLSTPFVVEDRDLAIATGTIVQLRFLGGAIGLAIASNILNGHLTSHMQDILPQNQLHLLLENADSIANLPQSIQFSVKSIFASSYKVQFQVMIGFAAAQLPATILLLKSSRQIVAAR